MQAALEVHRLSTSLFTRRGKLRAVDSVSFSVLSGQTLAIVGESGCGKSLTALSVMRLLPEPPARIEAGKIVVNGRDLVGLSEKQMLDVRGKDLALIPQNPMSSLNPVAPVGNQIAETLRTHMGLSRRACRDRACELLDLVGVADASRRIDEYPHRLSGGLCQRVLIAMAIACRPGVLIADEPTTALDVTVQAQVLGLLGHLQAETKMAMVFITHDLGVVAEIADRVVVMYAGRKVEEASTIDLFEQPLHPYTQGLIGATPMPGTMRGHRLADIPGAVPALADLPKGCAFAARCKRVMPRCLQDQPPLVQPVSGRAVACFLAMSG